MYRMPRLLSTAEVAETAGLAESSVRTYRTRGQLPAPDATIGNIPGWLPETIEPWAATLPGRGARTDLPQPDDRPVTDPVAAARKLIELIRSCIDTSALDAPDHRSPYQPTDRARQTSWTAAGHLARAGVAYAAMPWLELADDLGDLDDVADADDAAQVLRAVDEHTGRARARIAARRTPPDWHDHVAVLREMEHIARRAADLRMVSMVESALRHADEGAAR
jgi:predicted DNA-binding transcriptional regulator AlpA